MAKDKKYIIVNNATKDTWRFHFEKDPTKGIDISAAVPPTPLPEGRVTAKIYHDQEYAQYHCEELNDTYPKGNHAVCPLDYGKTSVKH